MDNSFKKSWDLRDFLLFIIFNLLSYKFSKDLTELGFETLRNKEIDFSANLKSADQIMQQVQLQQDITAIVSLLGSNSGNQDLSNLLIQPEEEDPNSSSALFASSRSQRVLDRIKRYSEVINIINSPSTVTNENDPILDNTLPIVEVNVGIGESIAEALEEKLAEDKRLNRNFQTRSQSAKLDKFDFEIPEEDGSSLPLTSPPLLAETPIINDQELQLVSETTEATNNIIDETINRMLGEMGYTSRDDSSTQLVSAVNNDNPISEENQGIQEDFVLSDALSSVQRLREIEDIRAIFQILGIGS